MDAVVLAGLPTELPLKMFHEVLRVLVPGGMVQTSYLVSEHTIAKTEETVNSDLLMGGFVGSASVISTLRSQASVQLSRSSALAPLTSFELKRPLNVALPFANSSHSRRTVSATGAPVSACPPSRAVSSSDLTTAGCTAESMREAALVQSTSCSARSSATVSVDSTSQ